MALILLFHCASNGKFRRITEAARPKNLVKSLEQKLKGAIKGMNLGRFHAILRIRGRLAWQTTQQWHEKKMKL